MSSLWLSPIVLFIWFIASVSWLWLRSWFVTSAAFPAVFHTALKDVDSVLWFPFTLRSQQFAKGTPIVVSHLIDHPRSDQRHFGNCSHVPRRGEQNHQESLRSELYPYDPSSSCTEVKARSTAVSCEEAKTRGTQVGCGLKMVSSSLTCIHAGSNLTRCKSRNNAHMCSHIFV